MVGSGGQVAVEKSVAVRGIPGGHDVYIVYR